MCDMNTQLKKLHVTSGYALLCPPCLKEQARGFLLLSLQQNYKQIQLCKDIAYIWHVANCLMSYSNLSSKFCLCPHLFWLS